MLDALRHGRTASIGLGRADGRWFTFCAGLGLGRRGDRRVETPAPAADGDPRRCTCATVARYFCRAPTGANPAADADPPGRAGPVEPALPRDRREHRAVDLPRPAAGATPARTRPSTPAWTCSRCAPCDLPHAAARSPDPVAERPTPRGRQVARPARPGGVHAVVRAGRSPCRSTATTGRTDERAVHRRAGGAAGRRLTLTCRLVRVESARMYLNVTVVSHGHRRREQLLPGQTFRP